MEVRVSDEMVESPRSHLGKWEELVDKAPNIACRFHEEVMQVSGHIKVPKSYYLAAATYLHQNCIGTQSVNADLMVAFADIGLVGYQLKSREQEFACNAYKKTAPTHPISAESAMSLLASCTKRPHVFFKAYTPESEKDLLELVEASKGMTSGKQSIVRTAFRRNAQLVTDHMAFIRVGKKWCNEALFPKMSLEDRKLICKEAVLADFPLPGIPAEVYTKTRAPGIWMLQSTEWSDKDKADRLNDGLVMFTKKYGERYRSTEASAFFPHKWWSKGPEKDQWGYMLDPVWKGTRVCTQDYYGPVLFPEKVTLDMEGRLNQTGMRNLMSYLYTAQMKVKVKMGREEDTFLKLVDDLNKEKRWTEDNIKLFKEKLRKHLVK